MTEQLHDDRLWRAVQMARPAPPADLDSPFSAEAQHLLGRLIEDHGSPRRRIRSSTRRPSLGGMVTVALSLLVTITIGVVVLSATRRHSPDQTGASRIAVRASGFPAVPHSFVVPGSARLVANAPDPEGGPSWAVREIRTSRGQACLSVGRQRGQAIGVLGTDGAWGDDHGFHPLPLGGTFPSLQLYCGDTDAQEHPFINVTDNTAVRNAAGDAATDGNAPGAAARRELCPISSRNGRPSPAVTWPCPAGALRSLAYGLLGPDATSITYIGPGGRQITQPTSGPDGAYLIVALPPRSCARDTSARSGMTCPTSSGYVGPQLQSGVITQVTYRTGRVCHLPPPNARGLVHAAHCPLVGYRAPQGPALTEADLASPVKLSIPRAAHYCVSNAPNVQGCKEVSLDIDFTARIAVRDLNSYYEGIVNMPPRDYTPGGRSGCPGAGGALQPIGDVIAAGQRIHWHYQVGSSPKDCTGALIHVTVAYVANSRLGLNGISSKPFPSPGTGAIVVGRATIRLP